MASISAAPTTSSSASSGLNAATVTATLTATSQSPPLPGKAPPTSKTVSTASMENNVNVNDNDNNSRNTGTASSTTMSGSGRPHRSSVDDQDLSASTAAPTTATAAHTSVAGPASPPNGQSSQQQAGAENISYSAERIIGNGSFGVVFEAKVVETNEVVAIKKVLQDKRFKNRELQIMRQLVKDPHTNIVALKHCFYSQVRYVRLYHITLRCVAFVA